MEKSGANPGACPRPPACFPKNLGCSPFPSGLHSEIRKNMVAGETAAEVHKDFGSAGFHLGRFGGQKKRTAPGKVVKQFDRKDFICFKKLGFSKKNFHFFVKAWFFQKNLSLFV